MHGLRLRCLLCGKAAPFRRARTPTNLLKALPSRRRGEEIMMGLGPERRSLSAQRSGRAARTSQDVRQFGQHCGMPYPYCQPPPTTYRLLHLERPFPPHP
jgi:hypothetical protein